MAKTKVCRTCRKRKAVAEYYAHANTKDRLLSECKECVKSRVSEHRRANLAHFRAYDRERNAGEDRKAAAKKRYAEKTATPEDRAREWAKKKPVAPIKRAARLAVREAIRVRRLVPGPCEVCGTTERIDAHHEDYFAPFDVVWLCKTHHGQRHWEINDAISSGEDWSDRGF